MQVIMCFDEGRDFSLESGEKCWWRDLRIYGVRVMVVVVQLSSLSSIL